MVEESAHDLRLGKHVRRGSPPPELETANRPAAGFQSKEDDRAWESGSADIPPQYERRLARGGRTGLSWGGIAMLPMLVVLGVGVAVFYPSDAEYYLASLKRNLGNFIGVAGDPTPKAENRVAAPSEKPASLQETEKSAETDASIPERDEPPQPKIGKPAKESAKSRAGQARSLAFDDREIRRKKTELQIVKAIQNRAIDGVQVSVVEGTAFLDGRVATERQKSAAERATRSVSDVKEIQNRIEVNQESGVGN